MKLTIDTKTTPNGDIEVNLNGRYVGCIVKAPKGYRAYSNIINGDPMARKRWKRFASVGESALYLAAQNWR